MTRPIIPIPPSPSTPFPINVIAEVVSGFGRGSAELGIPTANIPITPELNALETGVYFGWCKVLPNTTRGQNDLKKRQDGTVLEFTYGTQLNPAELSVLPFVMSIGWNPFYQNKEKTAEIHIIHKFSATFYGASIKFDVLGYIRPELDYTTRDALIADINIDIKMTLDSLSLEGYQSFKEL